MGKEKKKNTKKQLEYDLCHLCMDSQLHHELDQGMKAYASVLPKSTLGLEHITTQMQITNAMCCEKDKHHANL